MPSYVVSLLQRGQRSWSVTKQSVECRDLDLWKTVGPAVDKSGGAEPSLTQYDNLECPLRPSSEELHTGQCEWTEEQV